MSWPRSETRSGAPRGVRSQQLLPRVFSRLLVSPAAAEANMCGGLQRGQTINKIHNAPGVMDACSLPSAPAWSLVAASASAIRPHRLPAASGAAVKVGVKSQKRRGPARPLHTISLFAEP